MLLNVSSCNILSGRKRNTRAFKYCSTLGTVMFVFVLLFMCLAQQSRKLAAMSSSSAISGGMGNSGISAELLVYRT